VPLSLAAGVAGSAVLTAAQARLLAMVSQQKAEFLEATVSGSLDRAAADAADKASQEVAVRMQQMKPQVQQIVARAKAEVPPEFTQQLVQAGVSASAVDSARAAVPKGAVVFGAEVITKTTGGAPPSHATTADLDQLFDAATSEATAAVRASITERAAAEKAAILRAAEAFGDGDGGPSPG
jgi:hypothetical protein